MRCVWGLGLLLIMGCCTAERQALKPLPDGPALTYDEMVNRARAQAALGLEAFYVDGWRDLEEVAQALETTAKHLPKTEKIPERLAPRLVNDAEKLRLDAVQLGEAARAKSVQGANDALQRIHVKIRELRLER